MKSSPIIIAFLIFSIFSVSFANDCRIVEYPDKIEVICVGDPQTVVRKNPVVAEQRQTYQPELIIPKEPPKVTTVAGCKLLQANHYNIAGNNDVEVEVSCEITGRAAEFVQFILDGVGRDGAVLIATEINGYLDNTGSAELKTKFITEYEKFINSHKWEPSKTGSSVVVAKTYLFNEKATFDRIAQLKQEVIDRTASTRFGSSNGQIIMKKGVIFNHTTHQMNTKDCTACHKSSPGRIAGFGKDFAHKTCKECHNERRQGPTNCKGCHTK